MNPFENPELYDKLEFGGLRTPGVATLSGFERTVKWDRKPGGGVDGESTTRVGKEAASGTVTVYLVDEPGQLGEQDEWRAFAILLQKSMDQGIAYDVFHPDLLTLDINSAVCTKVGQVVHDGKGGATATFALLEYRPQKKKPASKPKSKGSPVAAHVAGQANNANALLEQALKQTSPNAAAEAELAALKKQAQELDAS